MMKSKKFLALAGVAALAVVGGSFAYYSSFNEFNNEFDTTNYSTSSTEKFNPNGDNKDWKPGVEVEKKIFATNTGDGDVWVRIKFSEKWMKQDENHTLLTLGSADVTEPDNPYHFTSKDGLDKFGFRSSFDNSKDYQGIGDDYDKDGNVSQDSGSVVGKTLAADWQNNWYFNEKDGYFYYKKVLTNEDGKNTTADLLESVTLCEDTDMGRFDEPVYYIAVEKDGEKPVFNEANWTKAQMNQNYDGWTWGIPDKDDDTLKDKDVYTYKGKILDKDLPGYANADYQLDIKVDFLQTNEDGKIADTAGWDTEAMKEAGVLTEAFIPETSAETPAESE